MTRFVFFYVEKSDVFLCTIKMQSAKGFAVVVIYKNTKVTFGISVSYTGCLQYCSGDCFNNMISLELL